MSQPAKPWRRSRRKLKGLGDVVAAAAQPLARGIDRVLGTDVQHCQGCKQRQQWLNDKVPFGQ